MTSFISEKVTNQMSMCLATIFGLSTWMYVDLAENHGLFSAVGSVVQENGTSGDAGRVKDAQLIMLGLVLLMILFIRRPVPSIVFYFFIHNMFEITIDFVNAFSIAVIMGSVVAVIFDYFGILVEYAADTIFYCFALEAESGARQVRLKDLYNTVEEQKAAEDNDNNNSNANSAAVKHEALMDG